MMKKKLKLSLLFLSSLLLLAGCSLPGLASSADFREHCSGDG